MAERHYSSLESRVREDEERVALTYTLTSSLLLRVMGREISSLEGEGEVWAARCEQMGVMVRRLETELTSAQKAASCTSTSLQVRFSLAVPPPLTNFPLAPPAKTPPPLPSQAQLESEAARRLSSNVEEGVARSVLTLSLHEGEGELARLQALSASLPPLMKEEGRVNLLALSPELAGLEEWCERLAWRVEAAEESARRSAREVREAEVSLEGALDELGEVTARLDEHVSRGPFA